MLRAILGASRVLRLASVILAITAMLCVCVASVSAAHTHLKDPIDRCDVCCTAHQAAQQVALVQVVQTLELQSFLVPPVAIQRVESPVILAFLTRGPPASVR